MVWPCWGGVACVPHVAVQWRAGPVAHPEGGERAGWCPFRFCAIRRPGGGGVPWPVVGACFCWARGLRLEGQMAERVPPPPGVVGLGWRLQVRRVSRGGVSGDPLQSPCCPRAPCAFSACGSGYHVAGPTVAPGGGAPGRPSPVSPGACVCVAGGAGGGGGAFARARCSVCLPSSGWSWPAGGGGSRAPCRCGGGHGLTSVRVVALAFPHARHHVFVICYHQDTKSQRQKNAGITFHLMSLFMWKMILHFSLTLG